MEDALGAQRRTAPAARRQRHGRDRRRSRCSGTTTQIGVPIHLRGTPGAIQGPRPAPGQHNDEIFGELGYSTPRSRRSAGGGRDARARRCARSIDFGQYLAGPFGPMIIGDLGADVIKVEPVTGDGMRMVGQPFFGCQRGKRDIALDLKTRARARDRARAGRARRHRPPQHDRGRREAARHRLRRLQAREPRHRLLQHVGVRPRGPARALRRPRPALPGVGRARVRSRARCATATRRSTTASACPTPRTRCSRSSAASPRCTTSARTGEGQELWTSLLDGGAMFASDALLVDGEAVPRPRLDKAPDRHRRAATGCTRPQDGWIQIAAVRGRALGRAVRRARRCPSSLDDARFAIATPRAEHRQQLESLLEPRFATRTAIVWTRAARRRGRAERDPDRHARRRARAVRRRQRSGSASSPSTSTRSSAACASSATLIDFSETPGHIAGPPPLVGEHTLEILEWLGYDDAQMRRAQGRRRRLLARRGLRLNVVPWTVVTCSSYLSTLPLALRGSASTTSTRSGAPCSWPCARGTTRSARRRRSSGPGAARRTRSRPRPCARRERRRSATWLTAG